MSLFKKLFGIKTIDFNQLLKDGAYIIDVRTSGEFNSGNIKESTNIPLDTLKSKIKKIESNSEYRANLASIQQQSSLLAGTNVTNFMNKVLEL